MTKPRVAILGLGIMGSGMAGRLLSAGFPLAVYNRNTDKAAPLRPAQARPWRLRRGRPRPQADIIISMVSDDIASRGVWLGENGALAGAARGSVLIESSTLTVGWVKELALPRPSADANCSMRRLPEPSPTRLPANCCSWSADRMRRSPPPDPFCRARARIHSSWPDWKRRADEAHQQFHVRRAGCLPG